MSTRRLCRFLGVRDDVPLRAHNANPARRWRSRSLSHFLHRVPSRVIAIGRLFPGRVRHRVRDGLWKLNESKGYKASSTRSFDASLTLEFTAEVEQLGKLIGRDLSAWCKA